MTSAAAPPRRGGGARRDDDLGARLARSVAATEGVHDLDAVDAWFDSRRAHTRTSTERIPFGDMTGWHTDPRSGDLVHDSGRFFAIRGMSVRRPGHWCPEWDQPVIVQPEVGILGLLAMEVDGLLHVLVQAKDEPGNAAGIQLAPTVQATRSNFTRVHRGDAVPYVSSFVEPAGQRVLLDALQSEQGSWFHRKQNRNVCLEVAPGSVTAQDAFCWMTLGQVYRCLRRRDLVNMDLRSVLAALPLSGADVPSPGGGDAEAADPWAGAVARSCAGAADLSSGDVLGVTSLVTSARAGLDQGVALMPLADVRQWRRDDDEIVHDSGAFFRIVAVRVDARGREVRSWCQPMLEPVGQGLCGLLVRRSGGVVELLLALATEPGLVDGVELGPTVQATPATYARLPGTTSPAFLDEFLAAAPERFLVDVVLSEEGGRFRQALNRYVVVDAGDEHATAPPGWAWVPLSVVMTLLPHPRYLNVQARTLVATLHGLLAGR